MIDRPQPIEFTLVAEDKRLAVAAKLFANYFVTFESTVYAFADRLSKDYNGAYWQFYTLSNGGFSMAPSCDHTFYVRAENGFQGELMPNAFGICCCMYAFSHLSFSENRELSERCTEHFHRLRKACLDHPDGGKILAACD
ncbi:MAG: hypothetical protein VR73_13730 [Gammaproteobacteria bacterium BRH_c0]|nr:MAG: hypothetical protein VR73_13730 [Gammaproteobacteria bacterium BRH_c0]